MPGSSHSANSRALSANRGPTIPRVPRREGSEERLLVAASAQPGRRPFPPSTRRGAAPSKTRRRSRARKALRYREQKERKRAERVKGRLPHDGTHPETDRGAPAARNQSRTAGRTRCWRPAIPTACFRPGHSRKHVPSRDRADEIASSHHPNGSPAPRCSDSTRYPSAATASLRRGPASGRTMTPAATPLYLFPTLFRDGWPNQSRPQGQARTAASTRRQLSKGRTERRQGLAWVLTCAFGTRV